LNHLKEIWTGHSLGVYWQDRDIERIKTYCQKDVVAVAQLLLKFKGMELLKEKNISFIN
jgi:hypothetical protein